MNPYPFLIFLITTFAQAGIYESVDVDYVHSVYDGDTFRVTIDSWPEMIGKDMPIRIKHVDTPEIRGECEAEKQKAIEARDFVKSALDHAETIQLTEIDRGKYFRLVASVSVDGKDLAELIIKAGLGRPYEGGHREGWCD